METDCTSEERLANIMLTFDVCRKHGHGSLQSMSVEAQGVPALRLIPALAGVCEQLIMARLTQEKDVQALLETANSDGEEYLDERGKKRVLGLLAHNFLTDMVVQRAYPHATIAAAYMSIPLTD